ncbi:MAG: sulfatase [Elusimicrobiota bacterium]
MKPSIRAVLGAAALAVSARAAPNVVVIDICSVRADHMGAYGYSRDTTPRIDGLARKGALFENTLAQGSWCLPNYATLFTGRPSEAHGLYTNRPVGVPRYEPTLAETLRKAGYETAAFSGGVYLIPEWGLDRGFDVYVNSFSTGSARRAQAPLEENLDKIDGWLSARREKAKPFFLYMAVDNLHAPIALDGPDRYDADYEGVAVDTRTMGVPFARAYSGESRGYAADVPALVREFKSDPRHLRHYVARYDSAMREMDAQIGRFLDGLKKRGLDENTIVVLTGDHGESLGEHGLLGHTSGLYEPTLRVPLIVVRPDRPALAGKRFTELVERVDLMPTILEWAGAGDAALKLPGRSLEPLLADPAVPWRRYAFASSRRNLDDNDGADLRIDERVVRDGRWKLHWSLYKDFYELYDLADDPGETRDVAARRPEVVARLSFEMLRWLERNRPLRPSAPEIPAARIEPSARSRR